MALPNLNKIVLAQVYVMMDVSGTTGGTTIVPVHEVCLLRKKVRDIGKGVKASFSLDDRNRPGWQYRIGEDGQETDEERLPRVKGMTLAGFRDEYARLTRKYKYQITENRFADAFAAIYESQRRLSDCIKQMHKLYDELSGLDTATGARKRLLTIEDWERVAGIANPEADLLELDELQLAESLPTAEEAARGVPARTRPAGEGNPKAAAKPEQAEDGVDLEALAAHLKEINWSPEIIAATVKLVDEHGLDVPDELIIAEHIPGVEDNKRKVSSLMRSIADFAASKAVSP